MATSTRLIRRTLELGLPWSGVIAIMVGALVANDVTSRFGLTVLGTGLLLLRAFGMDAKLLPSERRFPRLRAEVDQFIETVRNVNAAAMSAAISDEHAETFRANCDELQYRAQRIALAAGATHGLRLQPRAEAAKYAGESE